MDPPVVGIVPVVPKLEMAVSRFEPSVVVSDVCLLHVSFPVGDGSLSDRSLSGGSGASSINISAGLDLGELLGRLLERGCGDDGEGTSEEKGSSEVHYL